MNTRGFSPFMAKYSAFNPYRLLQREHGYAYPIGTDEAIARSLYCGFKPIASWSADECNNAITTGGIFNLEFSPEGNLLVAACEKKCIQLFDPLTHKMIHSVTGAHSDCVNCVKEFTTPLVPQQSSDNISGRFLTSLVPVDLDLIPPEHPEFLDGRMFATCSDDTTIALWDIRNLKKNIRSLHGHSNWVKNIEFSVKDKLLVTSGLDGSIYTWDINSYTECNLVYQRVFHASGLMRCRLSPDAKQMVMCTTGGLLVIIHNLELSTLAHDLHGFKPNLYRLMQMSQQLIPIAALYDHLFEPTRKQNRVEFVTDFPDGNDAKVISSLQIHPQGWSALSRNISHDDRSEWTCIHDIQADPPSKKAVIDTRPSSPPLVITRRTLRRRRLRPLRVTSSITTRSGAIRSLESSERISTQDDDSPQDDENPQPSAAEPAPPAPPAPPSTSRAAPEELRPSPSATTDVWEASITVKQHRILQELQTRGQMGRNFNMQRITGITTGITPPAEPPTLNSLIARDRQEGLLRISPSTSGQTPSNSNSVIERTWDALPERPEHFIRQNRERLLYYTEEPNEGKGFIKELCFSMDGRLVCSPFGRGMRLLAFNNSCSELPHCASNLDPPAVMTVLGESTGYHRDLVVCSKFSPRHHLLVTGCLEGKIVWYQPFSGESILNA